MFDNVGGLIKGFAKGSFWIEAIGSVIAGIALMCNGEDYGLFVLLLGPGAAFVFAMFCYGFGQLIENSDIIAEEHDRVNKKREKVVAKKEQKRMAEKQAQRREVAKVTIANPNVDEDVFVDITCPNCKADLSYTKGQLQSEEGVVCPMCDTTISL